MWQCITYLYTTIFLKLIKYLLRYIHFDILLCLVFLFRFTEIVWKREMKTTLKSQESIKWNLKNKKTERSSRNVDIIFILLNVGALKTKKKTFFFNNSRICWSFEYYVLCALYQKEVLARRRYLHWDSIHKPDENKNRYNLVKWETSW